MSRPAKKPAFVSASDMVRVECTATTRAAPALAWKVFTDWRRWTRFSDAYGDLQWMHGTPWDVGSRLRIERLRPIRFIVNRVITTCHPAECVAWIDHSRGSTLEQWVTFEIDPGGLTCVRILSQGIGPRPKAGGPFAEYLKTTVTLWLDAFCKQCDQMVSATTANQ